MKNIVKMAVGIIALCFSPFCMAQQSDCAVNSVLLQENEVPVFITIGQSNADGSAFADAGEDRRLAAWYDNPDTNPGLMKIWYRSCHIVNQTDGARWVFDGTTEDVAPGWLDLYYKNDNLNGKTMMNMIHSYGTWSAGAAGRRGMEGEFGMHFQQAFPDMELYIIKLGCSGSRIETWASSSDSHNWGYFYENLYKPAINDLLDRGKKPRLAGIWWMQGEGNGIDSKEHYLPLLKSLIEKCRTRLGFPDAHVYIGHIVKPGESVSNPKASVQYGQGVRDAQDAVVNPKDENFIPNVSVIDARESPFDKDNLHWGHVGINNIGRKIATEVISAGHRGDWATFCPSAFKRFAARQHTCTDDPGFAF
ncbi:sialate O-acetylesterase [uncultured Bacteroides sp.]|uniref:sialate O-acetylesterase n=1 Tax=uncultured Bacteroides sp. TaxID=162156 RepID=UPI002589C2CA|nr:sialate O-acetylesterase [uncultured Bacteroides sp.]